MDVSLTRTCNYDCSYCNQRQDLDRPMFDMSDAKRKVVSNKRRSGKEWIDGLNAFPFREDYDKLIFSGGEPSLHSEFFDIVSKVTGFRCKIIVTNLSFDVDRLIQACRKENTKVIVQPSFHFEFAEFDEFVKKLGKLRAAGLLSNFIPVSIVSLPDRTEPQTFRQRFRERGFDASLYRYEGYYKGKFSYAPKDGFGGWSQCVLAQCSGSTTASTWRTPTTARSAYSTSSAVRGATPVITRFGSQIARATGVVSPRRRPSASWTRA